MEVSFWRPLKTVVSCDLLKIIIIIIIVFIIINLLPMDFLRVYWNNHYIIYTIRDHSSWGICFILVLAVHSIPSYPDTLGPGTARISDMPVTQNTTHTLQIIYLSPTSRWESPLSNSFNTSSFFSRVTVRFQSKNCPFNSGRLHFNSKSSNLETFTAAKDRRIYRGR